MIKVFKINDLIKYVSKILIVCIAIFFLLNFFKKDNKVANEGINVSMLFCIDYSLPEIKSNKVESNIKENKTNNIKEESNIKPVKNNKDNYKRGNYNSQNNPNYNKNSNKEYGKKNIVLLVDALA